MIENVLVIFLCICLFAIIQSIFGVGLLVFGTPTLLLLGYPFYETLSYLLPSSIVVSFFQVYNRWNYINLYKFNVFFFLLPMVALGLLFLFFVSGVNISLHLGIMLFLIFSVRLSDKFNRILQSLFSNNFRVSLAFIGFIHGLTNLGGGPLVVVTNGIYDRKVEIQANIAYAYLTMAIVQIIILIGINHFTFNLVTLILPLFSLIIYLLLGEYVFESTNQNMYENAMSFLILIYSLLLIRDYFI